MASALYDPYKQKLLDSSAPDLDGGTIKVHLVDNADYTFSAAHEFEDDITGAGEVATGTLDSTTIASGKFDAADEVLTSVTGDACESLVIWEDTGGPAGTDPLVVYIDGFSVTPNGGDITIEWDAGANGIFTF
jgi:hypothetical protein